jgi:tetratricopeptide (TPR) repeat protein
VKAGRDSKGSFGLPELALALLLLAAPNPALAQQDPLRAPSGERAPVADSLAAAPGWSGGGVASPRTPPARESALLAAWHAPLASLERRVESTRRAALEVGVWELDAAAQALVQGSAGGTPVERARAAVALAPHLPAAHLALARTLWLDEEAPMDAVRAVVEGMAAIAGHTEASLWFAGSGLYLLSLALIAGSLGMILLAAALAAPHAAHDLSHLVPGRPAEFARAALLGALLLVPVALGEGVLGFALAGLAVAVAYGNRRRRVALGLALAALFAGLHPLPRWSGAFLDAFPGDPVAQAAYSLAHGTASPTDIARLEAAREHDPLALRGLAIHARQQGHLGRTDALYQQLIALDVADVAVLNNAANVRLDLGHVDSALDLYQRALGIERSAVVLFNLAQAYGLSFQVDDLNRTIEAAQRADGELIAELAALQRAKNEGFIVDLPLAVGTAWSRVLSAPPGDGLASELRAPLAPGRLGASQAGAAGAFLAAFCLAWAIGAALKTSRWCARCGERQCHACGTTIVREVCEGCTRLFDHPERTDRTLRVQRIEELQERERRIRRIVAAASVLLPGSAGLLSDRPMRGLLGAVCFALAAVCLVFRQGVVPDPLIAGAAAPVAFLGTAAIASLLYVAFVAAALTRSQKSS